MQIKVLIKQEDESKKVVIDSKNFKEWLHYHLSGREFTEEEKKSLEISPKVKKNAVLKKKAS